MIDYTEEEFEGIQLAHKEYRSLPQRIMMKKFDDCGRDVFRFWNSIEWDSSWLRHDTEEEKIEKEKERQWNSHPFKDFIDKDSILL
jgi:hypothetical protein